MSKDWTLELMNQMAKMTTQLTIELQGLRYKVETSALTSGYHYLWLIYDNCPRGNVYTATGFMKGISLGLPIYFIQFITGIFHKI